MSMGIHPSAVSFDDRFNHRANSKRSFQVHFNSCKKKASRNWEGRRRKQLFLGLRKALQKDRSFSS